MISALFNMIQAQKSVDSLPQHFIISGIFDTSPWHQWLFLVPVKGGRWHIIPQLAVYTTYIPLIYCLLGGCMLPTTFYRNHFNNHWWHPDTSTGFGSPSFPAIGGLLSDSSVKVGGRWVERTLRSQEEAIWGFPQLHMSTGWQGYPSISHMKVCNPFYPIYVQAKFLFGAFFVWLEWEPHHGSLFGFWWRAEMELHLRMNCCRGCMFQK